MCHMCNLWEQLRVFLSEWYFGGSGNLMERCYVVRKKGLKEKLCKEIDWVESGMIRSGGLTSLVFHRCLSFGSEVHFGRHSSSFLGRYIFKCPCSSATRARQNRIFSTGFIPYWAARLLINLSVSLQQNADCKITIPDWIRKLI